MPNEFEQRLVDAYNDWSISVNQILSWPGVYEKRLRKVIKEAGCPPRPHSGTVFLPDDTKQKIADMCRSGRCVSHVAKEIGVSRHMVQQTCKQLGIQPVKGKTGGYYNPANVEYTAEAHQKWMNEKVTVDTCQAVGASSLGELV